MNIPNVSKHRYDTVEYIKKLRHAQFSQEQSEAIAQGTESMIDDVQRQTWQVLGEKDLATRSHVSETELKLVKEIELIRKDLRFGLEMGRKDLLFGLETGRAELKLGLETGRSELQLGLEVGRAAADLLRKDMLLGFEKAQAATDLLRTEMYVKIAELKTELIRWQIGIASSTIVIIVGLLKYL